MVWVPVVWDSRTPKNPNPFHFRGSNRNPNHRAPNQQLTTSCHQLKSGCLLKNIPPNRKGGKLPRNRLFFSWGVSRALEKFIQRSPPKVQKNPAGFNGFPFVEISQNVRLLRLPAHGWFEPSESIDLWTYLKGSKCFIKRFTNSLPQTSIYLSIYLTIYLSIDLSIHPSIYLSN